ncbi:hypothetical protein BDQ94DRAFT_156844 [Aspergillus welwitschiae]|uniref:Altered inheritance of mitochondria protein 9, mitochondrial n=1 Tax=Aspergillus welwitschiae TaxID=1341132 RepID=A0A3F3QFU2_9EURO|nr:hypothetical protein BDQ94DRAFT_156844 [Aspergillus welwitschiae]RDH38148.1 hypothetical protein BDQ94DRAFT_156844 [Aspergillus welwitschiae]
MGKDHCPFIVKLAEGGFKKVFLLGTNSGKEVIARIPTPIAGPPHYTTASEIATMAFLRDILEAPIPKVLVSSTDSTNPVGAECIIMERIEGFWHGGRSETKIDRGPWLSPKDCFTSAARRETACILQHAKPRPRSTFLHPTTSDIEPSEYTSLLSKFLKLAPSLIPTNPDHTSPILRHPDLNLNNILIAPNSAKIARQIKAKAEFRSEEANLYYTAATGLYNDIHWSALKIPHLGMRHYLYQQTGYPWDGDVINIRAALVGIDPEGGTEPANFDWASWRNLEYRLEMLRQAEEDERDICWRNWPFKDDTDISSPPRDSLVVTHPTTNLPACGLSTAERTGSPIFHTLWSTKALRDKLSFIRVFISQLLNKNVTSTPNPPNRPCQSLMGLEMQEHCQNDADSSEETITVVIDQHIIEQESVSNMKIVHLKQPPNCIAMGYSGYICKADQNTIIKHPRYLPDNEPYNQIYRDMISTERQIYECLGSHKGIIPYLGVHDHSTGAIKLACAQQGDLENYIQNHDKPSEAIRASWIETIVETFWYIYSRKVLHQDVKPNNILVHDESPKVADFGNAEIFALYANMEAIYMKDPFSRVDILGIGCIIYSIAAWRSLAGFGRSPCDKWIAL